MVNTRSVRAGNSSLPLGQGQLPNNLPPQLPPQLPPHIPNIRNDNSTCCHATTVFQLVLAQLLARNNLVDPLINLLNPAPQPPAPQQNPQPIQHALALSESQGQSHIAPAQQPLPDDVTRRLDSLEKSFPLLFEKVDQKTTSELMRVKQRDGESLKNYMSRFNDAVLEVSSFDQAVGIAAVIPGLNHDRFRDSLIKHPATTFSEVNDRSLKFITAEEYALVQNPTPSKNQNPEWRDDNPSKKRMRMAQNRGPMSTSTPRFEKSNSTPPQQSTEQCNSLRSELECLAQKGMLNESES
ncbi:hypothetical protein SLEP1_g24509 [Rubroshorea leprosula]|uniref:Retrotransposon gag domain-containing protein n=1 Tax=Rubroshorea leprosula TaxID=152421 RepID=A0AAV5JFX0_9ROSI|nr:hypothetical protein SLEP1_g24509 [Rubroshorea leprosula]